MATTDYMPGELTFARGKAYDGTECVIPIVIENVWDGAPPGHPNVRILGAEILSTETNEDGEPRFVYRVDHPSHQLMYDANKLYKWPDDVFGRPVPIHRP